ncbi:FkbM family methyltransferase [Hymenobacter caeli]|uniref:FkbM family methyltransferase n=1 Tax=Hymenobacter caeli TaxID=2735894 RepID=A0ABX2FJG9_9BACT|nr:FkbM family methyltransferase [Hymenobacter caeli]NRT17263.1 FkbM family methyltransferase [Hymenobacter caeli]
MKNYIKKLLQRSLVHFISNQNATRIIQFFVDVKDVDIIGIAYRSIGILKYQTPELSGEAYLMNELLSKYLDFSSNRKPIIFDVGANVGNYSIDLSRIYPDSQIFSFEPNPSTFNKLKFNTSALKNIQVFNFGLGSKKSVLNIYTYQNDLDSEHASVYREVLSDLHLSNDLVEKQVAIETISDFCNGNNIEQIDFLKIDTEGFEYEVLKGAIDLINRNKISIIQFEFNEMNVISRVFLKDFYDLLQNYELFRLDSNRLINLGHYNSINEIFKFQNIIAIRNNI